MRPRLEQRLSVQLIQMLPALRPTQIEIDPDRPMIRFLQMHHLPLLPLLQAVNDAEEVQMLSPEPAEHGLTALQGK